MFLLQETREVANAVRGVYIELMEFDVGQPAVCSECLDFLELGIAVNVLQGFFATAFVSGS